MHVSLKFDVPQSCSIQDQLQLLNVRLKKSPKKVSDPDPEAFRPFEDGIWDWEEYVGPIHVSPYQADLHHHA